jgi:hypothetical protein
VALHCFDSVVPEAIPPAAIVLGYVDGAWPTYDVLHERFKKATTLVVSVTTGTADASILDCERGNATPDTAAKWAIERLSDQKHPTIYGGRDALEAVMTGLRRRNVRADLVSYFLADWTQVGVSQSHLKWPRRVPAPYAAWQFAGSVQVAGGHRVDASIVNRAWAERLGWTGNAGRSQRRLFRVVG